MKFCHQENVEHYFWKLLYYNLIELLRKQMDESGQTENNRKFLKNKLFDIIGNKLLNFVITPCGISYQTSF